MLPDLDSLALFVHAAELRNLTRAAEPSHITVPAASRRLALLEHQFKAQLFERHSRGLELTPAGEHLLQLARTYTVFARDGDMVPLTMLRIDEPATGVRVIEPGTAQAVRRMLEMAAGPGGTAPKAQVAGYRVAGKTGTAHKIENGRYVNKYIASFVGFAPVSDPRIVIAVMVDEPSAGQHYGGQVAAPIFSRIAGDALRALRVPPDAPQANRVIPAEPVPESICQL